MNKIFEDLVIFEIANNHQGSVEHGIRIIKKLGEASRKYKLKAGIKFQYRNLDTFIHPDFKNSKDIKHIPRFLSTKLSDEEFIEMVHVAREEGLLTICTPFDENSVDKIVEHNYDILKIASCSALDWPLLEKAATSKIPIIISTGGKTFTEIDKIYNFFLHRKCEFALLHCVGMYPVKAQDVQLNVIKKMSKRYYNVPIGYSGHEEPTNYDICKMALAIGATILERHVGLETADIKLNAYSTNVEYIEEWLNEITKAREILGDEFKKPQKKEINSLKELQRGIYAKKKLKKGVMIAEEDIYYAMPMQENQMSSGEYRIGMIATKDYEENELISEKMEESFPSLMRSLIHKIKGQLAEAKIYLNDNSNIEFSHQYGIEKFENIGVTIVNIINREYCKKILILLPGQVHPSHYHGVKEETFHILSGILELEVDEKKYLLNPGDIITVFPKEYHGFSSEKGCIFEEVSTTHTKGDSFYKDKYINSLDLLVRKTLIEKW